eukprot:4590959-Pleurochrysis_carterae.AAC.1
MALGRLHEQPSGMGREGPPSPRIARGRERRVQIVAQHLDEERRQRYRSRRAAHRRRTYD